MIKALKYLNKCPPAEALELIRGAIPALHTDWQLNIDAGVFRNWVGVELTFEEFMAMMAIDRTLHELKQEIDRRG